MCSYSLAENWEFGICEVNERFRLSRDGEETFVHGRGRPFEPPCRRSLRAGSVPPNQDLNRRERRQKRTEWGPGCVRARTPAPPKSSAFIWDGEQFPTTFGSLMKGDIESGSEDQNEIVTGLLMDHKGRMKRAQEAFDGARLDALIVTHLPSVRYLCGFTGSAGILVINSRESVFFTDGRYTEQSREEVKAARIRIEKGKSVQAGLSNWINGTRGLRRIGIEAAHLSVADRDGFAKFLPRGAKLVKAPSIVEQMRMIKDASEVKLIRNACHLGVKLFDRIRKVVRQGIRESQVAGAIEYEARKLGAEQMAFSTIIAGGSRSALPHGRASWARLPARGFVVCDFGVILAGYCSDMTRTLHLGRPGVEARAAYEAVKEAQQAAINALRPGSTLGEVDRAARKLLYNRRLGKQFTHSTGHGLGLEIHEAPRVAAGQNEILRSGMVITIEPGVYLPGKFGVSIEDTVVVTENGCEILTPCSKEMITI